MTSGIERPQFYKNNLQSIDIDKHNLVKALADLRAAVVQGVEIIEASYPPPDPAEEKSYGSVCDGHLGIALTYLRLAYQSLYLRVGEESPLPDFRALATARINLNQLSLDIQPGRLSPVSSAALGAVVLRIIGCTSLSVSVSRVESQNNDLKNDMKALLSAIEIATQQSHTVPFRGHSMGGDDIMTGRAGLLWAIANIQQHVFDDGIQQELNPIFEALPKLLDAIMDAGRVGAQEYTAKNGDANAFPLMWLWLDGHYGLGG